MMANSHLILKEKPSTFNQSDVAETIANNANSEALDIDPDPASEFVNPETGEAVSMFGD